MALLVILGFSIFNRTTASLKLAVSHTVSSRSLKDGRQATFFNAWIRNRSTTTETYHLAVRSNNQLPLKLNGQTEQLEIAGGNNRKLDYVLVSPPVDASFMVEFVLIDSQNQELATAEAQILPLEK